MRSIRRIGGVAVAGLLLSGIATGGPANAQTAGTPATYTGTATARALQLAIATSSTTEGASTAKASSDGTSEATGAGVLGQANTTAVAKNPPGETKPEVCADSQANALEAQIKSVLVFGVGCGSASATGSGLTTVSTATGKVATLEASLQGLGITLPAPVAGAVTQVTTGITTGCASVPATPIPTIPGITAPPTLRDVCLALANTLGTTSQSILSSKALAADFGSSTSGVAVAGDRVTTEATASGTTISILPGATLNGVPIGEPLATISIARANARVVCDLASGTATPSFDPAIVRVKLASILAAALPAIPDAIPKQLLPGVGEVDVNVSLTEDGSFTVTPGAKVVLFAGLPLQTEIVAGAGTSKVNPDGSATSVADGVKVHALQLAPAPLAGGILVNLAHAETAGACVAATSATSPPPPAPPVPEVTRELPRTGGGDTPWLPIAGVAALALAVMSRRAVLRTR